MSKILITGGTGFVGANLTRRLLKQGHEIHLFVRPNYQSWRIQDIKTDLRLHTINLEDEEALKQRVDRIKPDRIFHLAVHGAYSSQNNLQEIINTNIIGTVNLLQACIRTDFEVFVNTGSSSEYGYKDYPPTETEWLEPNSYYAITKASATLFCRYIAQNQNLRIPTLRLYSVYGAYEEPTRLMPTLIAQGLKGELPPLVNPKIARDYVYIDDVIEAYLLAAMMDTGELGAVYNVGTGKQTTLQDVIEIARRVLKINAKPEWGSMPDRQWDTSIWVADNRKIQSELGWTPDYTFEQGFQEMVNWYKQQKRDKR
ncbi:NAD-dependent epimerase/dehydratase family protein [Spirulina sp. 06S082]|uniref:NAD-dependent epimerase/dehydratase family protein n=1 Tax=Spirulina sp. 06S082 TaxID=3110248 RepID=UPI002B219484|nr:NAD-dependent epimerase/dehydratase family protein [Spirulina sp. 06S082]MEA5470248.1 NAD-dependent epimerase/dehydratase family protein [Spirulina sp. 06S082]